jgi:NhaP-type Na+/H+ or K+/H+ antiporter
MSTQLAIFFALIVVYGAVSVLLGRFSVTMPIIFVIVGALLGSKELFSAADAELLIEMTLALLLFADASTLAFRQVRDDPGPPGRLLLIAMPLIVALGGLVAYGLFPGKGLALRSCWELSWRRQTPHWVCPSSTTRACLCGFAGRST